MKKINPPKGRVTLHRYIRKNGFINVFSRNEGLKTNILYSLEGNNDDRGKTLEPNLLNEKKHNPLRGE